MINNAKKERDEIIFDALLKAASDEIFAEEMESLPTDEEIDALFPNTNSLDKKVQSVINQEFRTLRIQKALRVILRSAAILCVAIVLGTGILMANPASRYFILNYLINVYEDHIRFDFGIAPEQNGTTEAIIFRYVPEGFELTSSVDHINVITYIFENAENDIIMMQYFFGPSIAIGIDNEYSQFSEIQIAGRTAYLFESIYYYRFNVIMWPHYEDAIMITASLNLDLLISLAEMYMTK